MKKSLVLFLSICLSFAACNLPEKDKTREFIPGMYVRPIEHEFGKGSDTLNVRQLNGNTYEIIKRSGIIPIRNGKEQPFKQKEETWTGIYDEKDQVIFEQRHGKVISFVPDENKLLVGASSYLKVK